MSLGLRSVSSKDASNPKRVVQGSLSAQKFSRSVFRGHWNHQCPMFSAPPSSRASKWIAFAVSVALLMTCVSIFYAGFFPVKVVVPGEASYSTLDPKVDLTTDGTVNVRHPTRYIRAELR